MDGMDDMDRMDGMDNKNKLNGQRSRFEVSIPSIKFIKSIPSIKSREMEDVEQEVMWAVVRAQGAYRAERGKVGAFVCKVMTNAARMYYRARRKVRREVEMGSWVECVAWRGLSPAEIVARRELPEWYYQLCPCHQQVCRWILQRVSRREMARRLGMSVDTFYRTVWRELRVSALRLISN